MVTLADLLRPDRTVNLPLIMLAGLAEYRQQHNRAVGPAPIRYPDRHLVKPEPQFPHRILQVIRPRPAQPGTLLGEHAGDLVDPFEVTVAEAVEPVADLRLQLEAVQLPLPASVAHAGHGTDSHRLRMGAECNDHTGIASIDGR